MTNKEWVANREWIAKGNTGCTFAALFAKNPEVVGWKFIYYKDWERDKNIEGCLISIEFPPMEVTTIVRWYHIRDWALVNGFYLEDTSEETEGLRILCPGGVAWVQYFGPDSHVPTRRTPNPMLMFTARLGVGYYAKVGFKGILHLAHAFWDKISEKVYDLLWDRSYKQVEKKIGHKPTIKEAAKTTFLKEKL